MKPSLPQTHTESAFFRKINKTLKEEFQVSARWFSASLMCVGVTVDPQIHLYETRMELINFLKMSHIIKASTKFISNEVQEK